MTRHSRQWETEYQGTGVLEKKVSSTLSFPGKVVGHNRINEKESESELVPSLRHKSASYYQLNLFPFW